MISIENVHCLSALEIFVKEQRINEFVMKKNKNVVHTSYVDRS